MTSQSRPQLIDRCMRERWTASGSTDIYQRAIEEARHILETHKPDPLPADVLAAMGARGPVKPTFAAGALLYGFVVVMFGMRMGGFLPGGAHVLIQVLHLLLGLGVIGLAESIAAKIKRAATSA